MDVRNLFKGVAVVIDDEVEEGSANIQAILKQLEDESIPLLKYSEIPDEREALNFGGISFLLLDWRLVSGEATDIPEDVKLPSSVQEYDAQENISFIQRVRTEYFFPIFIFTNEDPEFVQRRISESLPESVLSSIFIKSKSDLQYPNSIFANLESWVKQHASVYVLKEWELEYSKCKNRLFLEFEDMSSEWPKVIWNASIEDQGNGSLDLGNLISKNLQSRMTPFEFNGDVLGGGFGAVDKNQLRKVLEGERYLSSGGLHDEDVGTGDLFVIQEDGAANYYLNLRAQCDLVRNDNPMLYCVRGVELVQKDNGKIDNISFNKGQYLEKPFHSVLPFVDGGKILEFQFKDLHILGWQDVKEARVGRVLPPYITKIQQKYAMYQNREGLLRIPEEAVFDR